MGVMTQRRISRWIRQLQQKQWVVETAIAKQNSKGDWVEELGYELVQPDDVEWMVRPR